MPTQESYRSKVTEPVSDSVPKINNEIAVGEDLLFQRRWWRFEQIVWWIFGCVLALNIVGLLGRGPLSGASAVATDGSLRVKYERIERFDTPSMLRVEFGPNTLKDGKLELWISESLVRDLGNQRIVPQPQNSTLDSSGLVYTFPAKDTPTKVEFALQPDSPGLHHLNLHVPGKSEVQLRILVVP